MASALADHRRLLFLAGDKVVIMLCYTKNVITIRGIGREGDISSVLEAVVGSSTITVYLNDHDPSLTFGM